MLGPSAIQQDHVYKQETAESIGIVLENEAANPNAVNRGWQKDHEPTSSISWTRENDETAEKQEQHRYQTKICAFMEESTRDLAGWDSSTKQRLLNDHREEAADS